MAIYSKQGPKKASYSSGPKRGPATNRSGSQSHSSARPSYKSGARPAGARPSFNSHRPHGGAARPAFGNNNRRSSGKKRGNSFERIDVSRFISKATIIEEEEIYLPTHTFGDFLIDERLKTAIANKQYIYPSPIQDKSIPHALVGRDILGIANTGTGKTAAFLIPIINKILKDGKETAIIIAPTRELALQIDKEFIEFTRGMKIWSVACVGGAPISMQLKSLRRGCNVVIGTPGRLLDLVKRKEIDLSTTRSIVLDEADRMLDMGFIDDITYLLEKTPKDRQGFFFSATLPKPIENLISQFARYFKERRARRRPRCSRSRQDRCFV